MGLLLTGLFFGQAFAQLEMKKYSINSGSTVMQGAEFQMSSSVAQADASEKLSAGNYQVRGGFWNDSNLTQNNDLIFKNSFEQ